MIEINGHDIRLTRGDSLTVQLELTTSENQPYIAKNGDVIKFGLKRMFQKDPIITKNIPTETLILQLFPEDTKSLRNGDYVYDVEITYGTGVIDTFINLAKFTLVDEVIV